MLVIDDEATSTASDAQKNGHKVAEQSIKRDLIAGQPMDDDDDDDDDDEDIDDEEDVDEMDDDEMLDQHEQQNGVGNHHHHLDNQTASNSGGSGGDEPSTIGELRDSCIFLSHQMEIVMRALNVPRCACVDCDRLRPRMLRRIHTIAPSSNGGAPKAAGSTLVSNQNGGSTSSAHRPAPPSVPHHHQQTSSPAPLNLVPPRNATSPALLPRPRLVSDPTTTGRKSKYCTPELKLAVAEYAGVHGAAAAARHFGIPPSVAAYYQRKQARLRSQDAAAGVHNPAPTPEVAALLAHIAQAEQQQQRTIGRTPNQHQHSATPEPRNHGGSPVKDVHIPAIAKIEQSPATSTGGSPNFLRGRGRGRPKLIGDELDAELVEYMVQVKKSSPHQALSASRALDIARDYILRKAPGLLEEHGGHIKLKLTWAMKLVSRTAERQQEIELGLPPGSIAAATRAARESQLAQQAEESSESGGNGHHTTAGNNGAPDFLSADQLQQHMDMLLAELANQESVLSVGGPTFTSEISNVKELNLFDMSSSTSLENGEGDSAGAASPHSSVETAARQK